METEMECNKPNSDALAPLIAMTRTDGDALASGGAAAAQHGCAGLGFHARAESVCLRAVATIGLKCALGHRIALLFPVLILRLVGNIQVYRMSHFESSAADTARNLQRPLVFEATSRFQRGS